MKINACIFNVIPFSFHVHSKHEYQSSFDPCTNKINKIYTRKKDFPHIKYTIFKFEKVNFYNIINKLVNKKIYYANKVQLYNRKIVLSSTLFLFVQWNSFCNI